MQKQVLHNQSFADFTLHHCGKLESMFDLAIANGKSITEEIAAGTFLEVPDMVDKDEDILSFYKLKNIEPACGFTGNTLPDVLIGIDYMIIETDFIVA